MQFLTHKPNPSTENSFLYPTKPQLQVNQVKKKTATVQFSTKRNYRNNPRRKKDDSATTKSFQIQNYQRDFHKSKAQGKKIRKTPNLKTPENN